MSNTTASANNGVANGKGPTAQADEKWSWQKQQISAGDGKTTDTSTMNLITTDSTIPSVSTSKSDGLDDGHKPMKARGEWGSKAEFFLACLGFCIGLGNVWRFPYLCYKNGGGAFLIPYFICAICAGVPIVFLEISLGQLTQQGGISCWEICPIFKGVGFGTSVVVFFLNIYYIIVLAWGSMYFTYATVYCIKGWFSEEAVRFPWAKCDQSWNTPNCTENWTPEMKGSLEFSDPSAEFWNNNINNISTGIGDLSSINWEFAGALFVAWCVCYICVWKGVKWTGKIVYVTAVFPYVLLFILIVRGLTLEGAMKGVEFYLKPDFTRLGDPEVWSDAGTQVFYSYATSLGALTALGSYNKFNNNCYLDSIALCCIDSITSIFAGLALFPTLGFMAEQQGVAVADVADKGPGLAFVAYPKALLQMPWSGFWTWLFFLTLIFLGLDSQFVGVEGFVTAIVDYFPRVLRKGYRKEIFIGLVSLFSFGIGLIICTNAGMYYFTLMDKFSASGMTLLWFCIWECFAIGWAYGAESYYADIEKMLGYTISPFMKYAWKYSAIGFCSTVFILSVCFYKPLTYNDVYTYPTWALVIGWCMTFSSITWVPLYAVYYWRKSMKEEPDLTVAERWQKVTRWEKKCYDREYLPGHFTHSTTPMIAGINLEEEEM